MAALAACRVQCRLCCRLARPTLGEGVDGRQRLFVRCPPPPAAAAAAGGGPRALRPAAPLHREQQAVQAIQQVGLLVAGEGDVHARHLAG